MSKQGIELQVAMRRVANALHASSIFTYHPELLASHNGEAMTRDLGAHRNIYFKLNQGWGREATITLSVDSTRDDKFVFFRVECTWNTANYAPSFAMAAARLHLQAAELANLIEVVLADEPVLNPSYVPKK